MAPIEAVLGIQSSGTALEKEYRTVADAMERCSRNVPKFDATPYDPAVVEDVCQQWLQRMEVEHRSTTVFSALTAQLMEANATLDAKAVMLRMAQDELRHTETCGRVVRELGGVPERSVDLSVVPLAVHRTCIPEERALRNVIYTTCMSEMVAVARFVDTLDEMTDPYLRDVTRMILSDEILHGQYGFHYLEGCKDWLATQPEVLAGLKKYLRHAFKVIEDALAGPPVRPAHRTADEIALGVPCPARSRDVFYGTMEEAVVPGLERFGIEAGWAWKNRQLAG